VLEPRLAFELVPFEDPGNLLGADVQELGGFGLLQLLVDDLPEDSGLFLGGRFGGVLEPRVFLDIGLTPVFSIKV
jgi:hypothetical protein